VLNLYKACKRFGALPAAGGVLDQDPLTMMLLSVVAGEVEAWEAEQIEQIGR